MKELRARRLLIGGALAGLTTLLPALPAHAQPAASAASAARAARAAYATVTLPQAVLPSGDLGPTTLRWNPCRTLRYAINPAGAPAGFVAEARRAVAEMAHDSGLDWRYTGLSLIRPDLSKPTYLPDRLASEKLQLVIAWNTKAIQPHAVSTGESAGTLRMESGTITTSIDGVQTITPTQMTEAAIVIDRSAETALVANDSNGAGLYRLLLHQLGHAVGLDHVSDVHEIMNPVGRRSGPVSYGPGDLAGLRAVGRSAGCL